MESNIKDHHYNSYSWKLPFVLCGCNPIDQTPDTIVSRVCLHQKCKNKLIYCNECVANDLHNKLHKSHIYRLKEFFEKSLMISESYKRDGQSLLSGTNSNNNSKDLYKRLPNDIMKLYKEKDNNLQNYKKIIEREIIRVEELFKEITDEILRLFANRKNKLINHLNKTFEAFLYSYDLLDYKIKEYIKNTQVLIDNTCDINHEYVMNQLNKVNTSNELKDFINKMNEQVNQIQSINNENLDNICKFGDILNKFQKLKPELKTLSSCSRTANRDNENISLDNIIQSIGNMDEKANNSNKPLSKSNNHHLAIKLDSYEYLDELQIKTPLILACQKLNFMNTDEFQKICTEIMNYSLTSTHEINIDMQNTLAEYECFIQESQKSEDFAINVNNHFLASYEKPYLHYFHPNSKDLFVLYLSHSSSSNLESTTNNTNNNAGTSTKNYVFQKIPLDIPFNIPSNYASVSTSDGRLYLNGGKGSLDKMYEMNFEERRLIQHRSMKQRRWDHAICYLKCFIYVFGGADRDENYKLTKKCEKYDIVLDTWTELAKFSSEASDFSVCNFGTKYIYKFGGWNSISYINIIERYDIEYDEWTIINPPLKPLLGGFPECIQINERQIYVFGGFFTKGHDENFILEIDDKSQKQVDMNNMNNSIMTTINGYSTIGFEIIKLANKIFFPVRSQFKMPKSVLIHDNILYCIHKNKEQTSLLSFDGKQWKILNDNLYKNFEVFE